MRFRLLLLASWCVVGCARSDGDLSDAGLKGDCALDEKSGDDAFDGATQKGVRAHVEKSGDDDLSDAIVKGDRTFAEKPGADSIALLRGRLVILKPSRIVFRIPPAWLDHYDSPPKYPVENLREMVTDPAELDRRCSTKNNLHFTRQDLDKVKSGEGNEWDETFAKVVNDLLPFEKCVFHGGGEGWGLQGHSFGDLQMRVYLGHWELGELTKLVGERGLPAVRKMSQGAASRLRSSAAHLKGFTDMTGGAAPRASSGRTKTTAWQVESLTFPMWFYDYGATAVIDFYARKYQESTVVLVFMRTTFRGSQKLEIQELVDSFRLVPK